MKTQNINGLWNIVKGSLIRGHGILMAAVGVLFMMSTIAEAQPVERPIGSISVGPQVGFFKSKDADDARVMFGGAVRLKVSEAIGLEASLNYREEEYRNGSVTVKSWPVMVTGLVYPVPMIYGAIGLGWYNSAVDVNVAPGVVFTSETMQKFGWHFGGGVELPVGSIAKLVGDVRYVFLDYNFQAVPGSNAISSNFYVIDVGLLFAL